MSVAAAQTRLQLSTDSIELSCDEQEIYTARLQFKNAQVLELGCGAAAHTRVIAGLEPTAQIMAAEVDEVQHQKNLAATPLPNVDFQLAGAQSIPAGDGSFDIVMMFKSLHHVPHTSLDKALREIHRVLKPGGVAYISEPIFAGEFNDIIRLFHDEQVVRQAAFDALGRSIDRELFESVEQVFFNSPVRFEDFADFENKLIKATHTEHELSTKIYAEVKSKMNAHAISEGSLSFLAPMRVNIIRKLD